MAYPERNDIAQKYREIQSNICRAIEEADGSGKFINDHWEREQGGGGLTRVLSEGSVLEKAGVNFSEVHGELTDLMRKNLKVEADKFFATGVSIVMHPNNPHVPIIHMNIRYFELDNGTYWFGGGIDLTPHFVDKAQAVYFHKKLKEVCDRYDQTYYPRFKKWADDYFFIPHRDETRGIGGIFYDHLSEDEKHLKQDIFNFSVDLGEIFSEIYTHLIRVNKDKNFTPEEKEWQLLRRGRYVEFNLVYDRGTKFGLYSNGRTESILMSLPKQANWYYAHEVKEGSAEQKTLDLLRKGIDWTSQQ
jgi:coproporphyrinogen III oxidase